MDRRWPAKDPDEVLDYAIDWRSRLASLPAAPGDTIADAPVWIIAPAGQLTQPRPSSNTLNSAAIWLAGGIAGTTYRITCRIVTAQGRTMEETCDLPVKDKGN